MTEVQILLIVIAGQLAIIGGLLAICAGFLARASVELVEIRRIQARIEKPPDLTGQAAMRRVG